VNTDANEKELAQLAMLTPEEKQRIRDEEEKRLFGPYPATNRHERRKAAKLMRQRLK
jgi:hypothetical protein